MKGLQRLLKTSSLDLTPLVQFYSENLISTIRQLLHKRKADRCRDAGSKGPDTARATTADALTATHCTP